MKRNVITVVLLLVLCVVGLGFYRGWLALSSTSSDTGSNRVNINLTVDPDKVKADADSVKDKTMELTGTVTERVHTTQANELGGSAKVTK